MEHSIKRPSRSPLFWYGGKYRLAKQILAYFPPHRVYVEPFGGAAHLLFAKPPAEVEVYNDIYTPLCDFFWQLKYNFRMLQRKVMLTPYSRYIGKCCRRGMKNGYELFIANQQSISGRGGWGYNIISPSPLSIGSKRARAYMNSHLYLKQAYYLPTPSI